MYCSSWPRLKICWSYSHGFKMLYPEKQELNLQLIGHLPWTPVDTKMAIYGCLSCSSPNIYGNPQGLTHPHVPKLCQGSRKRLSDNLCSPQGGRGKPRCTIQYPMAHRISKAKDDMFAFINGMQLSISILYP